MPPMVEALRAAIGTVADSYLSCVHQANPPMSQGSGYVAQRNDLHQTPRDVFAECKL